MKCKVLVELKNFKNLGSVVSNEGLDPDIPFRIAQTTAARFTL